MRKKKTKNSKKKTKNSKKKIILIFILLVLLTVVIGTSVLLFRRSANINLLRSTLKFEYGDIIKLEGKDILDTKENSILKSFHTEYSNLKFEEGKKYPKVGKYELQITYNVNGYEKVNSIKIVVNDTKAPEFTKFSDSIEVKKGFDKNELKTYFEAEDLSPFEITIDTDKIDTNQIGEFEIEVNAIDKYKNKSVKKTKLIVIEDVATEPENSSNGDNGTSGNTNSNIGAKPTPYTVTEPRYVNGVMIVNKKNPVPFYYAPYENGEAGNQVRSLIRDMQNLGYNISNSYSGFRSFDTQAGLYQNYTNSYGSQAADTFSARPGYSEHQTGLAFDLLHRDGTLVENSAEVNWIAENAFRYGFIVRYQAGKEHITGYQAEPWHIRYIGSLAVNIYNSGLTLEEYLGVEGGSY